MSKCRERIPPFSRPWHCPHLPFNNTSYWLLSQIKRKQEGDSAAVRRRTFLLVLRLLLWLHHETHIHPTQSLAWFLSPAASVLIQAQKTGSVRLISQTPVVFVWSLLCAESSIPGTLNTKCMKLPLKPSFCCYHHRANTNRSDTDNELH